jgi:uncharacterized Zn-finger protein
LITTVKPSVLGVEHQQINSEKNTSTHKSLQRTGAIIDDNLNVALMTMVIDNQGHRFGGLGYDHMYSSHMQSSPAFNDPWGAHNTNSYSPLPKPEASRSTMAMLYPQIPVSGPMSSNSNYSSNYSPHSLGASRDIPITAYAEPSYTASSTTSYSNTSYPAFNYSQALHHQQAQQQRRLSDNTDNSRAANASLGELDASRGMLALSHQNLGHQGLNDLTPRNIYDIRAQRGSTDSYGFPSASSVSSVSAREYPYYGSSVASGDSATDYSSTASDAGYDSMATSRTLPRPSQFMDAHLGPPAPQSMMGQFSSKLNTNPQKKHQCRVCDKRFTRPSSLQTHMYSHTGEKPFTCNVEGCGRNFSVVSNLRRHKKVHKGEGVSSHSDGED